MTQIMPADVFDTLRKLRMDLTNAQGKLSDVMRYLATLNFEEKHQPLEPQEKLRRMIANGAIVDTVDLEAELRALGHPETWLLPTWALELRASLPTTREAA